MPLPLTPLSMKKMRNKLHIIKMTHNNERRKRNIFLAATDMLHFCLACELKWAIFSSFLLSSLSIGWDTASRIYTIWSVVTSQQDTQSVSFYILCNIHSHKTELSPDAVSHHTVLTNNSKCVACVQLNIRGRAFEIYSNRVLFMPKQIY